MAQKSELITRGPLLKNILLYTVPIILTIALQRLFNAVDLIVVGQYCGSISLSAVGATTFISNLFVNFFIGLSVGAGVSVAHAYGAKENEALHRAVHTAIPTSLVCGILITAISVPLAKPMLRMMDTPESLIPLSSLYLQIYLGGIVFNMLYNFSAAILRAVGDTKGPLIYLTIAGVLNVGLNVIFVTVFQMNVAGVALATTISQGLAAFLAVRALMRRTDGSKLVLRKIRFYKEQLSKQIRIGLPAAVNSSLFSISNITIQSSINSFGEVFMSGNAAAANIGDFVGVISASFYQGSLNFTGQNIGARQYKRAKQSVFVCMLCSSLITLAASRLAIFFGQELLGVYIPDSQEAIDRGMIRLNIVCAYWFIGAIMDTTTGALRGMGASTVPMVIAALGVCGIRILWVYTIFRIPQYHTPESLFISYPVSWIVTSLAQFIAFFIVLKKVMKKAEESSQTPAVTT